MSLRLSETRTHNVGINPTVLGGSDFVGAYRSLAISRDRAMIPCVSNPARDRQAMAEASARSTRGSTPGTCGYI